MKVFAIHDKDRESYSVIGYLICYEKAGEYIVELKEGLDEWEAPLLFQKYVREGIFTIPKESAILWVRERVIPSGRQNIGAILRNAKLKEYNELALLTLAKGKCSQDNCYLQEMSYDDIPENIKKRLEQNVAECFVTEHQNIVCLFRDDSIRKVSLKRMMAYYEGLSHVVKNEELFRSVKVDVGGYGIVFGNMIEIPVTALRDTQYEVPLAAEDFRNFVRNNIIDTTRVCEQMQCSRQNVSYLVNAEKLEPIMNGTKENLFTSGSVQRIITE